MITPVMIQIEKENGYKVTYIKKADSFYEKTIRERQHKCKIKEVIYGDCFNYYDEGMCFKNSLLSGSKIVIDNRNAFQHNGMRQVSKTSDG